MITVKPKIAVGISFYNDRECLRRCIKSLELWNKQSIIQKVILIDGKYKGFNSSSRLSGDYSRLVISKYRELHPDKIELHDAPNLPEWQKRQKYVDIAGQYKKILFLLIIDSDEYIHTIRWRELAQELKKIMKDYPPDDYAGMFDVAMYDVEQGYRGFRPRLWYMPAKMQYHEKHNHFRTVSEAQTHSPILGQQIRGSCLEIYHCKEGCRAQKRQEQQQDYEYRLEALER
jgi:hypothetical protein